MFADAFMSFYSSQARTAQLRLMLIEVNEATLGEVGRRLDLRGKGHLCAEEQFAATIKGLPAVFQARGLKGVKRSID